MKKEYQRPQVKTYDLRGSRLLESLSAPTEDDVVAGGNEYYWQDYLFFDNRYLRRYNVWEEEEK